MKAVKILLILCVVYVGIVAAFESLLGYFQPAGGATMVVTTTDLQGNSNDRVVARLEHGGQLYAAANHWPRAWYRQALANPDVEVTLDGEKASYLAVPASESEHVRVDSDNSLGLIFRFLTGFPPRYFVRLDPQGP